MGTSLTGTKPKDTYDSLIKVGDNGPISGTAKYLSDGLGNDLPIAVSTSNVGIGTTSPVTLLDVRGEVSVAYNVNYGIRFYNEDRNNWSFIGNSIATGGANANLRLGDSTGEVMKITGGVVELTKGQLKFPATQVTSADPNTLDDYEEGDWTPAITFGGGSTGITYASRSGKYTKIGRQVSVTGYILLTNKGTSTGSASIEGLPFAVGNAVGFYSAATLGALSQVTFGGVPSGYGAVGGSKVELVDTLTTGTQLGISDTNFTNASQILLQFTYFV